MRSTKLSIIACCIMVLAIAVATRKTVNAYVVCCSWSTNSATYTYDLSLPSGFYSATNYGATVWNNVPSSSWAWIDSPTSGNLVKYGTIDGAGNFVATTMQWLSGSTITKVEIKYDSAENWYTGSGTPAGNQIDLRSVAAHEFGHALGLEHSQPFNCPGWLSDPTMCLGIPAGSTHKRTLEGDDRSGVIALYP